MKVKELITELQAMPQDAIVNIGCFEDGMVDIADVVLDPETKQVVINEVQ